MIYEYAIDPELIIKWAKKENRRDFREFCNAFGIGTTRIPSVVMSKKNLMNIIEKSELKGFEVAKAEELIKAIKEKCIERPGYSDESSNWYKKALEEHNRIPFDFIFTNDKKKCDTTKTIDQNDIEDDMYHKVKKWDHPTQELVQCTTLKMVKVMQNMLRLSSHIIFLDPYLGVKKNGEKNNIKILAEFITASLKNNTAELPIKVEILYSSIKYKNKKEVYMHRYHKEQEKYKPEELHVELLKNLGNLSDSITLIIRDIYEKSNGSNIHNRYILTDLGGVFLGKGIEPSYFSHKDEFILLNKDIYKKKWDDYVIKIASKFVKFATYPLNI